MIDFRSIVALAAGVVAFVAVVAFHVRYGLPRPISISIIAGFWQRLRISRCNHLVGTENTLPSFSPLLD